MEEPSRTISDTPMGPYVDLMLSMSRRDKEIVLLSLFELIEQEAGFEERERIEEERKQLLMLTFCPENMELAKEVLHIPDNAESEQSVNETEYIMSSPSMVEILRQGDEDIKNGKGRVVKIEDLWK